MTVIGELTVKLGVDSSSMSAGMQKASVNLQRQGKKLRGMGMSLGKYTTLPMLAAGAGMVKLAGDAEETASKMDAVFGKAVPGINSQLDSFAKATGASRYAMREQAATVGALFKGMGLSEKATADMSVSTVKLAKDLSSFNNVAEGDALAALRSGLVGETEPLKNMGILLDEATVKQYAYANGIADSGAELTQQQKLLARQGAIMEQAAAQGALGDAEKTAGSFSNQLKRLQNSLKDVGTEMGMILIPIATKLLNGINGLIQKFAGLSPRMQKIIMIVGGIVAAIAPLLVVIGTMMTVIGAAMPVIAAIGTVIGLLASPIGLAIAAVVVLGIIIYKNWNKIKSVTMRIFGAIGRFITSVWRGLVAGIQAYIRMYVSIVTTGARMIVAPFRLYLNLLKKLFRGDFQGIANTLRSVGGRMAGIAKKIGSGILNGIVGALGALGGRLAGIGKSAGSALGKALKSAINAVLSRIRDIRIPSFKGASHIPGIKSIVGTRPFGGIPMLADGGIVTRPTLAMVGEAGAEAVIPLSQAGRFGMTGGGITIHVHETSSARQTAGEIVRELRRRGIGA